MTKPFHFAEVLARIEIHLIAARRIRTAHAALDSVGRRFFALDDSGELLWSTPKAAELLEQLPSPRHLSDLVSKKSEPGLVIFTSPHQNGVLRVTFVGRDAPQEWLFSIAFLLDRPEQILQEKFGLSAREAEVLLWISRGKSSRDIAEILSISPRTIDKHTEQLYNKAGFSGRAAAAAAASRLLGDVE